MNIVENILQTDGISDFEKLIVIWLQMEGGSTNKSSEELGKLFGKHKSNINRILQSLKEKRVVCLNESVKPKIITLREFAPVDTLININNLSSLNKNKKLIIILILLIRIRN